MNDRFVTKPNPSNRARPMRGGVSGGGLVLAFAWLPAAGLLLSIAGCGSDGANEQAEAAPSDPIVKTAEKGPVKMTVRVDHGEITIADRLHLTIEVFAEDGVDVRVPEYTQDLQAFAVRDIRDESAVEVEGGRRWRREYELDIFLSGAYPIPALTAEFTDRRKGPDQVVNSSLSTEPFEINVRSLVEGEFDPLTFRDVKGPTDLPMRRSWVWTAWLAAALAAVVAVWLIGRWIRRRLSRPARRIVVPAHIWAFDQLKRLADDQLVERGELSEFYFRLSIIIRQYIERRFGVTAPEMTTEEFLDAAQHHDRLGEAHRDSLRAFLTACDMVKFARYQPVSAEIEQAWNSARDFVDQTADKGEDHSERAAA